MKKWIFASAVSLVIQLPTCYAAPLKQQPSPDKAFNNLRFQYLVHTPRFVLETKILSAFNQHYAAYHVSNLAQQIRQAYHTTPIAKQINILNDNIMPITG